MTAVNTARAEGETGKGRVWEKESGAREGGGSRGESVDPYSACSAGVSVEGQVGGGEMVWVRQRSLQLRCLICPHS